MNRPVLIGGLALTGLIVAVLASGFGREPRHLRSPLVGRAAPPFTLDRVDGAGRVTLQSLKGRPAVVNFFATWCQPCKQEHQVLQEGARRAGSKVQFVGIIYEDEPERIAAFLGTAGSAYPTVVDKGGHSAIAYGVYGVPETFFLDANGKIVSKYAGPLTSRLLAQRLAELTPEGGT